MCNHGIIKDLIIRYAKAPKDAVAFSLYDGAQVRNVRFAEFVDDILKAANYFVARRISGQHIAIAAPNSYEWVTSFFGVTASGNTAILINQDLPKDILKWQCAKADVTMICGSPEIITDFRPVFPEYGMISFDEIDSDELLPMEEVYESADDETVVMIFTSGTTGKSKIVEISSSNLMYSIENVAAGFRIGNMERLFTPVPFFHIAGFNIVLVALSEYKTECLGRGIRYLFMDMPALNPTAMNTVPSIVESIVKLFKRAKTPEARARFVGDSLKLIRVSGAALNPATSGFLREMGLDIAIFYGMSETTGAAAWMVLDDEHIGSTGSFCKHTRHCFRDGELLLSGPSLMKGYYKDPEETRKIIGDGWIHTGDLGHCDKDGYLYLTGRKKNVIILSNGENVSPEEIEEKLGSCEYILESMVYGDGKGICAEVYTENQEGAEAFIDAYNADTPMYRQVYKVHYSNTPLEKTGTGKIKRKENVYA